MNNTQDILNLVRELDYAAKQLLNGDNPRLRGGVSAMATILKIRLESLVAHNMIADVKYIPVSLR